MAATDEDSGSTKPPQHPVPQLQAPFEESMMESQNELEDGEQNTDSVARRKMLLQGDRYERICAGRWKQRAGEKFHPLWKLSAQLSFGIHLLAQGLAKSEEEVMRILQSHVDDIDGFLERTTEDFDLAQIDVEERLRHLRLPLEHVEVFDQMLEDRPFRTSIIEGNEKIEHIVERTSEAMKDALKDVQKGIDATGALGKYLTGLKTAWASRTPDLDAVYVAMLGNVEGWTRAFMDLNLQGNRLAVSLVQLAGIVAEMQRRAGVASRKILLPYTGLPSGYTSAAPQTVAPQKQRPMSPAMKSPRMPQPGHATANAHTIPNKPLPMVPDLMVPARRASRVKLAHDEKLKRRSEEVLREQEERARLAQAQSGRKTSIAEKVRSISKRASLQPLSPKSKSAKRSASKSETRSKFTSAPSQSPGILGSDYAAESSDTVDWKERSRVNNSIDQLGGAVELPGDVPRGRPETSRKGGFHIHLRPKSRNKDHGSGPSLSKSSSLLRKSPPPQQSMPTTDSMHVDSSSPPAQTAQDMEAKQQAAPLQHSSPDPGWPTPPSLASEYAPGMAQPGAYTALPDVLATAHRARAVKGSLTVTIPSLADPESVKTPRAIPSQPSETVHAEVTSAKLSGDDSNKQHAAAGDVQNPSHQDASLDRPGREVLIVDPSRISEPQTTTAQDDDRTPTTDFRNPGETLTNSATAPQETGGESIDTPLTSATINSYSDFYKLPPQQTSATPPPITPDDLVVIQSTAPSSVASSSVVDQSEAGTVRESGPSNEQASTMTSKDEATTSKEQPRASKDQTNTSQSQQSTQQAHSNLKASSPRSPQFPGSPRGTQAATSSDLGVNLRSRELPNQSELFDLISATPPHSPIHARTPSEGSARLNVGGRGSSKSRILAPPEEAPAPPAPGGRTMINPDYAAAGTFEGERKSGRGNGISTGGWKKIFGGGGSAPPTSPTNGGNGGLEGLKEQDEEVQMSANMMNGEGSDVLWFKGMGRDGLWVSGA